MIKIGFWIASGRDILQNACKILVSNPKYGHRHHLDANGKRRAQKNNRLVINDFQSVFLRWALTDSNRRPSACKADALNQLS